ncbi:Phenoloxidase 1 [Frankliniella fusca]|uniref:Phenoloxidase 1 n=1 Tax=Frankliniella fusca TaxID=407009 RepID=A0AAE1H9Z0_9NEOP|nr:Phenoloxidase 1 [Frankliniella fusca]
MTYSRRQCCSTTVTKKAARMPTTRAHPAVPVPTIQLHSTDSSTKAAAALPCQTLSMVTKSTRGPKNKANKQKCTRGRIIGERLLLGLAKSDRVGSRNGHTRSGPARPGRLRAAPMRCSMPPPRPRRGFPCRRALDLGAALLTVLLVAPTTTRAAMCPPPIFKTLDVQCRWVLGRPVPCDEPVSPGTTAIFTCKPQYRLPQSVQDAAPLRPGQEPPEARALGLESAVCHDDGSWSPLPSSCVPECGRVVGNGETLVVDGKPVNSPLEFPWHVAIYDRKHKKGITQVCGGTLITPKFFVSAAHCFAGPQLLASSEVQMRPPAEFAAAVGKINRDWAAAEDTVQKRDVKQIYVNGYGGRRLNHVRDLALVEVDVAVELHAYTMPACVDWGLQERPVRDGDVGSVVGWGGLFKRPVGEKLQMASLPFVNKTRCLQLVPAQMVQYILLNDDRFCAGLMNGTTVAHGDSGGGLTFPSHERKHFLQGVVSVGMPDARTLTAFTNVTPFVRWMADKIQDEEIRAAAAVALLPLEIPTEYTASDLEEEQRVAYFREDVGLNLHHLHWHSYYSYLGPRSAVAKDRRGELLYYMHAQLLARYNGERLSNSLPRVKHLSLREPVKEGYYPKLDNLVSSRVWPSRPPGTRLKVRRHASPPDGLTTVQAPAAVPQT